MRHRLKWFIHLRAQGLSKGDEHPTNALRGVWYSLPFISERELTFTFAKNVVMQVYHKVKSTIPHEESWWGAHLPYLGREPVCG